MGTITFKDGTKKHIAKKKRKRYQPILKELEARCPSVDSSELETAAYVMALSGIVLAPTYSNPCFEDEIDYYYPEEDEERIIGRYDLLPITAGSIKSQFTRERQRELIQKYLNKRGVLDSQAFYLYYRFKRSRDLILKKLEELEDFELIKDWRVIQCLEVRKMSEPWAARRKVVLERLFEMIPKDFIPGHPEFGWRPGDPAVRRVYDTICMVREQNKRHEGENNGKESRVR